VEANVCHFTRISCLILVILSIDKKCRLIRVLRLWRRLALLQDDWEVFWYLPIRSLAGMFGQGPFLGLLISTLADGG
jgi:hypothetical protein